MRIELEEANRETEQGVKSSGWSKEFPKVECGVYWARHNQFSDADVGQLINGLFQVAGGGSVSEGRRRIEFLGPLSPSDTEELFKLREAARATLKTFQLLYDADAIPSLMQYQVDGTIDQLGKALGKE